MPAATQTPAARARQRASNPPRESSAVARFDPAAARQEIVSELRAPNRVQQLLSLLGGDERLVDRFLTVALHAATSSPRLLQADPLTIVEAVREAATLRLELNGISGQGYLVPYWNRDKGMYDAQFQAGYRGLLLLVERTRKVLDVQAAVVYEGDDFEYEDGSNAHVRHKVAWANRGNRLGTIAWARLPNGEGAPITKVLLLTEAEAELIRKSSKSGEDGPWVEWPDEMRKKTALRRLCKTLPQDEAVDRALALEAIAEERHGPPPPAIPAGQVTPARRARAALGIPASASEPTEAPEAEEAKPRRRGKSEPPADGAPDVVEGEARVVDEKPRVDPSAPGPMKGDPCPRHLDQRLGGGDKGVSDLFHSLGRGQGYCRPFAEPRQ